MPLALGLALLIGLPLASSSAQAARRSQPLNRVGSCKGLRQRLIDQITQQYLNRTYYRPRPRPHPRPHRRPFLGRARKSSRPSAPVMADSAMGESGGGMAAESAAPGHYTTTNNQVVGVDEADRVKTDGRHIYTISGNEVLIIKSWPVTATSIVARYSPGSGSQPQQLFLNGDSLVVLSRTHSRAAPMKRSAQWRGRPAPHRRRGYAAVRATVLDIQDRANPMLMAHVDLEGGLLQARMIGRDIYMVTNNTLQLPSTFYQKLNQGLPSWRGRYRRHSGINQSRRGWSKARLRRLVRRTLASVSMVDLLPQVRFSYGQGYPKSQRPLLGCGDLYAPTGKPNPMALLSLSHFNLGGGKVHATGVMASGWKVYASHRALYVAARSNQGTQVHKFELRRFQSAPAYVASGEVSGTLLNQFSMDEHRGYLRIATTDNSSGWRWEGQRRVRGPRGSNIFVMAQQGSELQEVGAVRGLAPGERIYAARLMGEKGLLTVGQDADQRGRVRGAHLQIFDVSDLKNPRRTFHHRLTFGSNSSSSAAQWDHHAFTYNARNGMLALPLTVNGYGKERRNFNGVILVKVGSEKGFSEVGEVEHSDLAAQRHCRGRVGCNAASYWNTPVQRSLFIDDYLFTLSHLGLKAHRLPSLSAVASLLLVR
jgi:uncharacterized secreted protein with C-terminal beta-propeller domain